MANPAYKGRWSAPLIDNPAYKGAWHPPKVPNPDYFEDKEPHKLTPMVGCRSLLRPRLHNSHR